MGSELDATEFRQARAEQAMALQLEGGGSAGTSLRLEAMGYETQINELQATVVGLQTQLRQAQMSKAHAVKVAI